jgi:hypothetical protein
MIASVEDVFLSELLALGDTLWNLWTHSDERFTCTNRLPSEKDMYLLSINSCTLALKALQSSVEFPIVPAWYPHCTSGSYPGGYGSGHGLRDLGSTNEFWIRYGRSWLYDIWIGSRGAFLLSILFRGLDWFKGWFWYPRPRDRWFV